MKETRKGPGSRPRLNESGSCAMMWSMGTAFKQGVNDFATKRPELVAEWSDRNSFSPSSVAAGSGRAAWWVCSMCGHEWMASIYSRGLRATGCLVCTRRASRARFN